VADIDETKILGPEDVGPRDDPIPQQVPVLPTRGAVIYPYLVVPLFVGRPRSVQALEAAMNEGRRIALVAMWYRRWRYRTALSGS
jgi:ATP-dependent Lon protease